MVAEGPGGGGVHAEGRGKRGTSKPAVRIIRSNAWPRRTGGAPAEELDAWARSRRTIRPEVQPASAQKLTCSSAYKKDKPWSRSHEKPRMRSASHSRSKTVKRVSSERSPSCRRTSTDPSVDLVWPSAWRTASGPPRGERDHAGPNWLASSGRIKQCDAPESRRHLTRRRPRGVEIQP